MYYYLPTQTQFILFMEMIIKLDLFYFPTNKSIECQIIRNRAPFKFECMPDAVLSFHIENTQHTMLNE